MLSAQARLLNQIFQNMPAEDADAVHDYVKERELNKSRKLPDIPKGVLLFTATLLTATECTQNAFSTHFGAQQSRKIA